MRVDQAYKSAPLGVQTLINYLTGAGVVIALLGWIQMLRQSQITVASERSRILIDGDPNEANAGFDSWMFRFSFSNYGKSAAKILRRCLYYEVLDPGASLPKRPEYRDGKNRLEHEEWLTPNEPMESLSFSAYDSLSEEQLAQLKAGLKTLWLFGIIQYRDELSRSVHQTAFCYRRGIGSEIGLHVGGPAVYTRCT